MAQQANFNKLVLLKGFSTYFDRKIFFYSTVSDYETASTGYYEQEDINFNPNDGIDTSVDLSSLDSEMEEAVLAHSFSYLLVLDENEDIVSRWYIMDVVRQTNGIYRFVLRRDVVAESINKYDFVYKAPIFVEKGKLQDGDPMIVNSEGMTFSQIKKEEVLLKDDTGWGYIVGYMANSASVSTKTVTGSSSATPSQYTNMSVIAANTGIDPTDLTTLFTGGIVNFAASDLSLVFGTDDYALPLLNHSKSTIIIPQDLTGTINSWGVDSVFAWSHAVGKSGDLWGNILYARDQLSLMINYIETHYSSMRTALNTILGALTPAENYYSQANLSKLEEYQGEIVFYSGQYYTLQINRGNVSAHQEVVIPQGGTTFFDNAIASLNLLEYYSGWELYLNYNIVGATVQLIPYQVGGFKYEISGSHKVLNDAPYSMFVIPYGDNIAIRGQGNVPYIPSDLMSKEEAMLVAFDIARSLGTNLYDLQLLPYFPEKDAWITTWTGGGYTGNFIYLNDKTLHEDYDNIITTGNDQAGIILYMTSSNFSFSIRKTLTAQDEPKVESQCNFYRLCSPNYNGVFEFNLAKNGGYSTFFSVECTYKPYSPFIRIAPQFNFLYGQNYRDGRGLICGGDFSLPVMSSAWENYQINNKNFANIFARDIQNLDFTQKQERFKEPFTFGAGIVGSGVGGAVAGGVAGGIYGAIAGGVIGTGAGIVGAALDSSLNEARRAEQKDYAIDRFNMSLANIKAVPDSLAKNSAFNIVNKIFPFIEYYSCTDKEKEALRNKIKYDGMTVGRIGTLNIFMGGNSDPNYFKGELIRAEGIEEDNHFVVTLYNELAKGVYI